MFGGGVERGDPRIKITKFNQARLNLRGGGFTVCLVVGSRDWVYSLFCCWVAGFLV